MTTDDCDPWIDVPSHVPMQWVVSWTQFQQMLERTEQRTRIMTRHTFADPTVHMRRLFVNDKGEGETYCGRLSHVERQRGGFMDVVMLCFDNAVCVPVALYGGEAQVRTGIGLLEGFVRTYEPSISDEVNGRPIPDVLPELIDRCKNMIGLTFAINVSGQKIKTHIVNRTQYITLYSFERSHLNPTSW